MRRVKRLPTDPHASVLLPKAILAAEPMPVAETVETVEELKAELDEIRSGGL
jgi:hypothetical protein